MMQNGIRRVAVVGNAPPRQCGLATFTRDLTEALERVSPRLEVLRIVMNDRAQGYAYGPEVNFELAQHERKDYARAADFLNARAPDVLCLQHEFGIFGGQDGRFVLEFLNRLTAPVVTTLHTVLAEPSAGQCEVIRALSRRSETLVVMSERGATFLKDIYGISGDKLSVIPHGIPDMPFADAETYKSKVGFQGKLTMLSFGLLGRNKGIETVIKALPSLVEQYPDFTYVVLGATHPHVLAHESERYREELWDLAHRLGVSEHVRFDNRYVSQAELIAQIAAADLYCTPYRQREQITSGTLAYALGAGKIVLSTPYWHAEELLADGRGILFGFDDAADLATQVDRILADDAERLAMRKRAYAFGRTMVWDEVARTYLRLFNANQPVEISGAPNLQTPSLPELRLDHIRRLTDDLGMVQHATFTVPNLHEGYTTDDNARALTLVVKAAKSGVGPEDELHELASRYLAFLNYAFNAQSGRFRNFMSADRRWLESVGSENSHARTIRALVTTMLESDRAGLQGQASRLFKAALAPLSSFSSPRAWALALMAFGDYLTQRFDEEVLALADRLAAKLITLFKQQARPDWLWCETYLSYSNAKLPQGLLAYALATGHEEALEVGLEALTWLHDLQEDDLGRFSPIGCAWRYELSGPRPTYDQQPIEAYASVDAYLAAWRLTEDAFWLDAANRAFSWFLGENHLGQSLYDPRSGGGYDGLHEHRLNRNQGAESTLSLWLAVLALHEVSESTPEAAQTSVMP